MEHDPRKTIINPALAFEEMCRDLVDTKAGIKSLYWKYFDEYTGGLRPREFSILCGSTGAGKTSWLANLSYHLLVQDIPHFVMSVENGYIDFIRRQISIHTNEEWNHGAPVKKELVSQFIKQHGLLFVNSKAFFSTYDNRVSVKQLIQDLKFSHEEYGCKVAFMDNLNFFMDVTTAANQVIETDYVIHELIMFCKSIDMHLVMVMHPKKNNGTNSTRVESEYDIKGSSTAVQEAHNVFLFNRPDPQLVKDGDSKFTDRQLKIAKMRRLGKFVGTEILIDGSKPRYEELGKYRP